MHIDTQYVPFLIHCFILYVQILGDDERAVINARYGLKDGLTQTVTTVAAKMGQTKSWVRSAECCALRKLRRPWYEKRLWEHQNSLSG